MDISKLWESSISHWGLLISLASALWVCSYLPVKWHFKKLAELLLHLTLVYQIFFKQLSLGFSSLVFLVSSSIVVWAAYRTFKSLWVSFLPLVILLLSRILPQIEFATIAVYLGSKAPAWVAASGLHSEVALPGLSYITFRWIRALIDIKKQQNAGGGFFVFLSYSFFTPYFLSGPISSYSLFEQSLTHGYSRSFEVYKRSLARVIWGLVKLYPLSSIVFQLTFSRIISGAQPLTSTEFVLGLIAYPAYLYFNFSGFTDVMIGLSALLGVASSENFDRPYLQPSIKLFWRSWHISLSTLLKDFIYVPTVKWLEQLGIKNRKIYYPIATVLVFLVMGVWHGNGWNFLAFAGIHALFLILEELWGIDRWLPPKLRWLYVGFVLSTSFFFFENSPERIELILKNMNILS